MSRADSLGRHHQGALMSIEAARLYHRDLNRDLHVFATDPLAGAA